MSKFIASIDQDTTSTRCILFNHEGEVLSLDQQSGAPFVVYDSETCRWQITHATKLPAVHPVELLSAAYDYPLEEPLTSILEI